MEVIRERYERNFFSSAPVTAILEVEADPSVLQCLMQDIAAGVHIDEHHIVVEYTPIDGANTRFTTQSHVHDHVKVRAMQLIVERFNARYAANVSFMLYKPLEYLPR